MVDCRSPVLAALTIAVLIGFASCSTDESSDLAFETDLERTRLLAELPAAEVEGLCAEAKRFVAAYVPHQCLLARAADVRVGLELGATREQLVELCEQEDCERLAADPEAMPEPVCGVPAYCSASVADVTACYNDLGGLIQTATQDLPDSCPELSRASLDALDASELASAVLAVPSCERLQLTCSGVAPEALEFAERYCEAMDPCCASLGLESKCMLSVAFAAGSQPYDDVLGQACLANLNERRTQPDFCEAVSRELSVVPLLDGFLRACGVECESCAAPAVGGLERLCKGPFQR